MINCREVSPADFSEAEPYGYNPCGSFTPPKYLKIDIKLKNKIISSTDAHAWVLYVTLLQYTDAKTHLCHPSIKELAAASNASTRAVSTKLKDLKANGFIKYQAGSSGLHNSYTFPYEAFYGKGSN